MIDNLIYSRLQHRRGTRRDLPQPLLPGEFGFCTDTLQLFIGSDPNDTTSSLIPTIRLYNDYYQTFKYGPDNSIGETSASEVIELVYLFIMGDHANYASHPLSAVVSGPRLKRIVPTDTIAPNDRFYPVNQDYGYVALGYPDSGASYTEYTWADRQTLRFFAGELKLQAIGYSHSDSASIASALNYLARSLNVYIQSTNPAFSGYNTVRSPSLQRGIVTTALNVEVSLKDVNNYEEYLGTMEIPLVHSTASVWSLSVPKYSTGMMIDTDEIDNVVIRYSLIGNSVSGMVYKRSGEITIMYTGNDFMVDDQYLESNSIGSVPGQSDLTINFEVEPNTGSLSYRMYGTVPAGTTFNMKLNSLKWRSF